MKSKLLLKKAFAIILSVLLVMSITGSTAFATDIESEQDPNEYIHFTQSNTRMASDGSFDFKFSNLLTSDRFTANSTYISINTRVWLYRQDNGETSTDNSSEFCLVLYHNGIFDTEVGRYYGYANNIYGGLTFNNIKKGDKYYFTLSPTNGNFHLGPYYFQGSGDVSPVTVKWIFITYSVDLL